MLTGGGAELFVDSGVLLELRGDVTAICSRLRRAATAMAAYSASHQRIDGGDACQLPVGHLVVGERSGDLCRMGVVLDVGTAAHCVKRAHCRNAASPHLGGSS